MKRYFKYFLLAVCSCALLAACSGGGGGGVSAGAAGAAGDTWTWVSGSDEIEQSGTYGTKGTAHADNVPGARYNAVSWIDEEGNLWLFGGRGRDSIGVDGYLNDLWKFDGTNWTWVSGSDTVYQQGTYGTKGTADADNVPGARYNAVSWIDEEGNLWLFGGNGRDSIGVNGYLNDLWKFDPSSGQWTWVSGSDTVYQQGTYGTKGTADADNVPGARFYAVSWIDAAGNLWLFGGYGYDAATGEGNHNDLWKFDPVIGQWTWVSGSDERDQPGIYGILGTPAAANAPGARYGAVSWIDADGNLWLFGGYGYDAATGEGYLNDLWKFDPVIGQWTWVSGSDTYGDRGTYGTKGTADVANVPGARYDAVSWIDADGNLWLFGGYGYVPDESGYLNDLWKFDPSSTLWTWVSGSNELNQPGTYGTKGTAHAANVLGARGFAVSWIDAAGNLWLFGGYGYDSAGARGELNDLWRYEPN